VVLAAVQMAVAVQSEVLTVVLAEGPAAA